MILGQSLASSGFDVHGVADVRFVLASFPANEGH